MTRIRLKHGKEADRKSITPALGEPLYASDSKRLYIGDGESVGGIPVSTGAPGEGVPVGGAKNQVLAKKSALSYDTEWVDPSGGGVSSVNGRTGDVVGLAEQSDLESHILDTANPHGVTKTQVGLSDVDNTSDLNKPVSTATQTAINDKVDKVAGKGLSTEDYTTAEKTKLSNVNLSAEVPTGGTTNQILTKNSNADYDTSFKDAPVSLPSQTGANGKFLSTDGSAASWNTLPNLAALTPDVLLSGTINGSNKVFTAPVNFSGIIVYRNGITLHVGDDYTITGANQITMVTAPAVTTPATKLTATIVGASSLMIQGSNSTMPQETPSGTKDGSNKSFTTAFAYVPGTLQYYVNGWLQRNGTHYTETNPATGAFTTSDAPLATDELIVTYQFAASVSGNADTLDGYHANATPAANSIPVLDSSSRIIAANKFSGCKVYKSAVQALTTGAYNYATFDTESYDTDNYHSTSVNTTRLTAPVTAYYRVSWHASFAQGAGYTDCWFIVNGSTSGRFAGQFCPNNTAGAAVETNGSTTLKLNAGDYIELMPYQTSGGNLNIGAGESGTYFTIEKVGE